MNTRAPPIPVTKIEPPRSIAGLLDRPRLAALLPLVQTKRLTVIKRSGPNVLMVEAYLAHGGG